MKSENLSPPKRAQNNLLSTVSANIECRSKEALTSSSWGEKGPSNYILFFSDF